MQESKGHLPGKAHDPSLGTFDTIPATAHNKHMNRQTDVPAIANTELA